MLLHARSPDVRATCEMVEKWAISPLELQEDDVAEEVHGIFQRACSVDAQLIGVDYFPPLDRSTLNLKTTNSQFYGIF